MDRNSRKNINKETPALNDTLDQVALIDNFRAFHRIHILFTEYRAFSRIDHMLGHKTGLNKFTKIEIIPSIFSDQNAMKLEINNKKNTEKTWKLNNMLLNNEWVNNEVKEEIKRYLETKESEDTIIQNQWDTGRAILKGKF